MTEKGLVLHLRLFISPFSIFSQYSYFTNFKSTLEYIGYFIFEA